MNSFIPWVGGKGKLLWIINKLMPDRYTRFIDVFGGSGTVTMCRPIQRGCMEVYNDFNGNLTNLFCCVKNRPMALLAELGFLPLNTRDDFNVLYKFFSKGEFTDDYYGLRRSEVLGLRWSAIDMEHKTISISHKVIEAEVDGKFVPMGEDVLKTKSSFRTLPLIPAVGIILLEEKEKQEMYRRLFKKSYCRDYLDYICVDQCGKLLRPNYVTEHFSWLIEKYGLRKVRFHDLRHTCASLLLSNGISMKQIQIWLGHSTFSTTADIYAHLDYSAQEASANAMNGMFNRPEKEEQLA